MQEWAKWTCVEGQKDSVSKQVALPTAQDFVALYCSTKPIFNVRCSLREGRGTRRRSYSSREREVNYLPVGSAPLIPGEMSILIVALIS
jgi:hypothetical protein